MLSVGKGFYKQVLESRQGFLPGGLQQGVEGGVSLKVVEQKEDPPYLSETLGTHIPKSVKMNLCGLCWISAAFLLFPHSLSFFIHVSVTENNFCDVRNILSPFFF